MTEPLWKSSNQHRILLDNGAFFLKGSNGSPLTISPTVEFNAVIKNKNQGNSQKMLIGNEAWQELRDGNYNMKHQNIVHPQIRGLLHDSDIQSILWSNLFQSLLIANLNSQQKSTYSEQIFHEYISQSCLAFTVQPFALDIVTERYSQIIFEDFGFDSMAMVTSESMVLQKIINQQKQDLKYNPCHLVINSGFSFTTAIPFFEQKPMKHAALRLDVGGKLMTNLLMESISNKEFNLQGEFLVVNDIKEKTCYIQPSQEQFDIEMDLCRKPKKKNPIWQEYALPDYKQILEGKILNRDNQNDQKLIQSEQISILNLKNDRFLTPEILFSPQDIGLEQGGIADMVKQIYSQRVPPQFQNQLLKNIIISGGNSKIQGFKERLKHEIEEEGRLPNCANQIQIYDSEDYQNQQNYSLSAWQGLKSYFSLDQIKEVDNLQQYAANKQEYFEEGAQRIMRKFYL